MGTYHSKKEKLIKKNIFILFISLLLIFPSNVLGQEINEETINLDANSLERIEKLKIPTEYLEELDPIILENLLENPDHDEFESSTTYIWSEEKSELIPIASITQDGVESYNERSISPMGTLPSKDFALTIDIYTDASKGGRKRKTVYTRYEWYKAPFYLYKDPFGVSWSDKWRPVDNTAYKVDYYKSPSASSWSIFEQSSAFAYSGQYGIGWDANLYTWALTGHTKLKGYGKVQIETKATTNPKGSDQMHVNYAHKKGTGSLGLSFGKISVNITGNASNDTRGNYKTFSY